MKEEEKEILRSLKLIISELHDAAYEDSFKKRKEIIPDLIDELEENVKHSISMEHVDFVRLKNVRAVLERSVAIWSTQVQNILNAIRSKPEYKKMVYAHSGVLSIRSKNLFTNILLDRFTEPDSFIIKDYQIDISKTINDQNETVHGEWYKITENKMYRYSPKSNEEGTFQRCDGDYTICIEIKKL